MSWFLVKHALIRFWVWIKEHWQIPFLVIWSVLIYVLTRRNTDALVETLAAKRDSYKKQLEVLRSSHNDEILKRDQLDKEYEKALKDLENDFIEKKKKITEKQKNDLKSVIIKSKGNPDEIRKRIEEEFGLRYVE